MAKPVEIIVIEIENKQKLQDFFESLGPAAGKTGQRALEDIVFFAEREAKDHARDKDRPPFLRSGSYFRSIRSFVSKNLFQVNGRIVSDKDYAAYLEFGTRPHVILPVNKKALFWGGNKKKGIAGAPHPVARVNHPGTPAYKVLTGAAELAIEESPRIIRERFEKDFLA